MRAQQLIVGITIDCNSNPAKAYPDEAGVNDGDEIRWWPSIVNGTIVPYEIEFKQSNTTEFPENNGRRSPFKKFLGSDKEKVDVKQKSKDETVKVKTSTAYFRYTITCSNGHKVDPMVRVPPI